MKTITVATVVGLSVTLASCSGEELRIRACFAGNKLAFELADVRGTFGARVRPRPSSVQLWPVSNPELQMWSIQPDLDETAPRRSIILYGEQLRGTTIQTRAKPLEMGRKYRILIAGGANMGATDFTFSATVPPCSKKVGT
ncbi:MAG: hypothetical protein ACTHOI_10335 [Sphingomicrobium sp.]